MRMRWMWLMILLVASPLAAADGKPAAVTEDPLDRQVLDIGMQLRCAVCQNQPVSESNADLARDMRALIREQLKAGKSRDEIIRYFVDRYGDYILIKPPFDAAGAVLWLLPPLLLGVLAVSAAVYLRRRTRLTVAATPAAALSPEDLERVRQARERQNRR